MGDELVVHCVREEQSSVTPLAKAILLTVHYRDLFSHALTIDEFRHYLVREPAENGDLEETLERLLETHLSRCGDYITWKGRESLVGERQARLAASARLWTKARSYLAVLRRIPFTRMAGISGSLAMNHARAGSEDIDLFCIAEPNRVWVVMLYLKVLEFYSTRTGAGAALCPNTCLAEDRLEISARNLYMAHQMVHVVPLWGDDVYGQFLRRNRWVADFLPNAYARRVSESAHTSGSRPQRWGERLLPNGVGNSLNTCICQAGVRKASRFYRRTHTDAMLRAARNPQRYMLPGLGYTGVIFRRFMEGHRRVEDVLSRAEMEAAFGCSAEVFVDPRLDQVFDSRYEHRD